MKNFVKILFLFIVLGAFAQSCTGNKEIMLNETPEVTVVGPTWQEIMPGQEDGQKMMVVFLPVENQVIDYNIDSIYFKGYHQNMTYKSKSSSGAGYQSVIVIDDSKAKVDSPVELLENQALVSYFDVDKVRRYFKVSDFAQAESIFMP
ncbi:MAG: hypothetical protein GQ574_16785 [Crocinitomix sp.]|nr:hypothetical protein [Crocinitomix sp.]